jgi:hypothetical protein
LKGLVLIVSKITGYQDTLRKLPNWDEYLLQESGLPGPRGNIELAQAVANEGNRELFLRYLSYTEVIAPVNSPYEFLAFCGALGLGRLLAEGDQSLLQSLKTLASDHRWRMREAVAMALQRLGDANTPELIKEMQIWCLGTPFEQRAAAAAICEPRLLREAEIARQALNILDQITASIEQCGDRHSEGFIALRKGLGYCWSVAVAALPEQGKLLMEKWLVNPDKDIRWIMQENLKKTRLERVDAIWVKRWHKMG